MQACPKTMDVMMVKWCVCVHVCVHAYVCACSGCTYLLWLTCLQIKDDFFAMLSEDNSLFPGLVWKSVKSSFRKDPRYKVVEGSSQREDLFKQYLEQLETQRVRAYTKEEPCSGACVLT